MRRPRSSLCFAASKSSFEMNDMREVLVRFGACRVLAKDSPRQRQSRPDIVFAPINMGQSFKCWGAPENSVQLHSLSRPWKARLK